MTSRNLTPHQRALALAALSGLKIALGPAFLKTSKAPAAGRGWVIGALGEMLLDKLGVFPPRYRPDLLIPHSLAGAWVAHESLKADGEDDPWIAPMGAAVAAGVSLTAPLLRMALSNGLGLPDPILGIAEDLAAIKLGTWATGMPLDRVAEAAREAVDQVGHQFTPQNGALGAHI